MAHDIIKGICSNVSNNPMALMSLTISMGYIAATSLMAHAVSGCLYSCGARKNRCKRGTEKNQTTCDAAQAVVSSLGFLAITAATATAATCIAVSNH